MNITPEMKQAMIDHLKKRLVDDLYEMKILNENRVALDYDLEEKGQIINKLKNDLEALGVKYDEDNKKDDDKDDSLW